MICPSCNKFATQSTDTEPELDLDVDDTGTVTGTARIVITSECCGDELKEAVFDVEIDLSEQCKRHIWEGHELNLEETAEVTERYETTITRTLKSGKVVTKAIPPRYQKHYYGVEGEVTVACKCGKLSVHGTFSDEIPASAMDEL
jgi:hypothetical protein